MAGKAGLPGLEPQNGMQEDGLPMELFEVKYIGSCKDKGRGSQAFGWVNDGFKLIFPEQVLRDWFEDNAAPGEASTLYAVLGMKQNDLDPKPFYRRMALQWHPDRCKDPNAHEQFIRIQEAYNILSNPLQRAKYDAGLALQASLKYQKRQQVETKFGYRAPLKCGLLMVEGKPSGRWFVVSQIFAWEDITSNGKVLSSSWPMGASEPVEVWL
jgi:hypothetical protein